MRTFGKIALAMLLGGLTGQALAAETPAAPAPSGPYAAPAPGPQTPPPPWRTGASGTV